MHAGRIADSLSWSDKVRRLYIISYVLCSYLVYLVYITNTFITLTNSIQRNANLISVIFLFCSHLSTFWVSRLLTREEQLAIACCTLSTHRYCVSRYMCICVFVYLCICVFVNLFFFCIEVCVFVYLWFRHLNLNFHWCVLNTSIHM